MPLNEVFSAKTESIPIENAVGRISADNIIPAPPGFPLLYQGEIVRQEMLEVIDRKTIIEVVKCL